MRKRWKQLNQLLKFIPLVSDKKDSNTDLPDSKAHALKYYPVVCLYFLYQSCCTGTQFKESNNSTNFVKKNCSAWHPLPCTREENYFSWVFWYLFQDPYVTDSDYSFLIVSLWGIIYYHPRKMRIFSSLFHQDPITKHVPPMLPSFQKLKYNVRYINI